MPNSIKLELPFISVGQSAKEVSHNQAILLLDQMIFCTVLSTTESTPPSTPSDGDSYLTAESGCSGDWASMDRRLVFWSALSNAWVFLPDVPLVVVACLGDNTKWVREFGGWEQAPDGQPLTTDFVDDLDIVLPNRAGKYATHLLVDPTVAMTAGRALEFPVGSNPVRMIVDNQTAQTITVKITGQTGVAVATATKKDLYFDGTDMVEFP